MYMNVTVIIESLNKMRKDKMNRIFPMLKVLAELGPKERKTLIPFLNEDGCEGLHECVYNALTRKYLPIAKRRELRNKLKKDEDIYRCILKQELCSRKRQQKLALVGGESLGLILEIVLPLISEYLDSTK